MDRKNIILVTGPASSGKSEFAESLATQSQSPVIYIATAQQDGSDPEWQAKIAHHQQRRPTDWQLMEVPLELTQALTKTPPSACVLIDSLGTWVANGLEEDDRAWKQRIQILIRCLASHPALIIIVAEETGWGLVPSYPLGRQFRDRLGQLTQQIGLIAHQVYLISAGYALPLHNLGQTLR